MRLSMTTAMTANLPASRWTSERNSQGPNHDHPKAHLPRLRHLQPCPPGAVMRIKREKPPGLRRFHGEPVTRLIVSVPMATVKSVDSAMRPSRNRSEFVRLAIEEKLARIPAKK